MSLNHGPMSEGRLVSFDPEWLLRKIVLGPNLRRMFRPIEEGVAHVPTEGPAILAANHLSFSDWIFIPLALNRRVTFAAKSDYFTGSGVKGFLQRKFFAGTGQVPVDRSGGRAGLAALRAGLQVLDDGGLFGIFPEGTRSHDGRLYRGRTGVARLALDSGAPVIPVGLIGTDQIAPPGKLLTRIMSPTVRFGAPLDLGHLIGTAPERQVLRTMTDEIMSAIRDLSGQTYVDHYAPTAKQKARREQAGRRRNRGRSDR